MDTTLRAANHILFVGDRNDIPELLREEPPSGHVLWLLACAAEDTPKRMDLLKQVSATHQEPYAQLAQTILEREMYFFRELNKKPFWRRIGQKKQAVLEEGEVRWAK